MSQSEGGGIWGEQKVSAPFIGEVRMFGYGFNPKGWALCNGQLLSIQQNQALFSLLGTYYGGNGTTNFALPNLQGRVPIHYGNSPTGNSYTIGEVSGSESVTVTSSSMPTHNHAFLATTAVANKRPPGGKLLAQDNASVADYYAAPGTTTTLSTQSVSLVGGGQAHNNMQPYLVINYCIALQGIFPSRN